MEAMDIPQPACVGFFPKATVRHPVPSVGRNVEEICSVSDCISRSPPDWIDHWRHNDLGFFDTEALAEREIPQNDNTYEIYTYKLYPLVFDHGAVKPWIVPVRVECDLDKYAFLGHDIVSRSLPDAAEPSRSVLYPFEHSPLSCNYACADFPVNRFCLIDGQKAAYEAAIVIGKMQYEPGLYYLFEVYRRQQGCRKQ